MAKALIVFHVLAVFILALPLEGRTFYCGGKLVSTGDSKLEVLDRCGEPDWVEERFESVYVPVFLGWDTWSYVLTHVHVEVWTYNFGPQRFIRIVRFRDGKVVDIDRGDYGY